MSATRPIPSGRLAAALSAALALGIPPSAKAALDNVVSCADDLSAGTLRQVIAGAGTGDTIDMSALTCSTITLSHGEIAVPQNDLSLNGPTAGTLMINVASGLYNRILHHTGSGILGVDYLTLMGGKYTSTSGNAVGGCISSTGAVVMRYSVLSGCSVSVTGSSTFGWAAAGGAIYSKGQTSIDHCTVSGNLALAVNNNQAAGGGILANGGLLSTFSTLSDNKAINSTHPGGTQIGTGGAAQTSGTAEIFGSTIDSNLADVGGGIVASGLSSDTLKITNSTLSGNHANDVFAGVDSSIPLRLYNSTIAFNSAGQRAAVYVAANATVVSSIIARNTTTAAGFADLEVSGGGTLTGSHNLIQSSNLGLGDNIALDPQLAPLSNHGGPTRTLALNPFSPAIDQGLATTAGGSSDQRGYARAVGAAPDIGAYERQSPDDEIFYNGFDG